MSYRLAADVGGTFTDLVQADEESGACTATKVPTTPDDIALGVIRGFDEIVNGDYSRVASVVYGTTAGLNALLQRAGAHTALVTTEGFRDVYEVGRGNHPDMYDNQYRKPRPLVARSDVFELDERIDRHGNVVRPVADDEVRALGKRLLGTYESVAIAFMHSYINDHHERVVADLLRTILPIEVPITTSSEVAPELGEYERVSTTVLNAYIAPPIRRYVSRLRELLAGRGFAGDVFVMQSNGGMLTEDVAGSQPVRIVMSGPVGGVIGARAVGSWLAQGDLLAIDMGGTSFDVSLLVGGSPELAMESQLEGFPVLSPSVQTLSVGAGGGSIAWTEASGMRVGPRSSGARPGPVCYGRGGIEPTTTDANVVLGRIPPDRFLGGRMAILPDRAQQAIGDYGASHGLGADEIAEGILTIANATMADAIRQITLRRGLDARDFTLLAYGGAGPLHAVELAEELDIDQVLVPPAPGAFSAWGMLHAELSHDGVTSVLSPLQEVTEDLLEVAFTAVRQGWAPELAALIARSGRPVERRSLDLRYEGQKYTVNLPIDGLSLAQVRGSFDDLYRALFGFSSPDTAVEVVNARLAFVATRERRSLRFGADDVHRARTPARRTEAIVGHYRGDTIRLGVLERDDLGKDEVVQGPAVIAELTATTFVPPRWEGRVMPDGSLSIRRTGAGPGDGPDTQEGTRS